MQNLFKQIAYGNSSALPSLSPAQEQLLHQVQINEATPGTILHDFQVLLDFVGVKGIEVSQSQQFLPLKSLAEINTRFSHPIQTDLKRAQQKSYPYIHGLYLLLRASGLSYVDTKGKKYILLLDPVVLESWNSLNPTERYFNLLEAWLIWGNEEILGERGTIDPFHKWLMFWQQIPDKGMKVGTYNEQQHLIYYPGLHNVALLELFGCLSVQSSKPEAGKGWLIKRLERTAWGDALLIVLYGLMRQDYEQEDDAENEIKGVFGAWQSAFQPFFPEWKHNLTIPEQEFRDGLYIFKVSLASRYYTSDMWRRIAISANYSLDDLSDMILRSVDFDNDHLHCFSWKSRYGWTVRVNHSYMDEPPFTTEFDIGSLSLKEGQSMTYLFDFGDHWEFNVQLERVEPTNSKIEHPQILESYGDSPQQYPDWDEEEDWEEEEDEED